MTALVTGATGFVGAAVARALLREGWSVRALARAGSDRRNLQGLAVEIVTGDLSDRDSLDRAAAGCTALFHVAADYRLGARDPAPLYKTNVEGTRSVLEAARAAGVARIVYTSSVACVGLPPDGSPGREDTPVSLADMIGHYKRSKFLAEQLVREAAAAGTPVVIVNPSTPIGPGDVKPTPTGQMVFDAATGRMPAYVDTGLNIVHVDDVAAGHLLAHRARACRRALHPRRAGHDVARDPARRSRGSTGRRPPHIRLPRAALLPLAYVAEFVAGLTGGSTRLTVEGLRMARKRMFFSSDKAVRELGYRWRPPGEAFADALRWLREQGLLRD